MKLHKNLTQKLAAVLALIMIVETVTIPTAQAAFTPLEKQFIVPSHLGEMVKFEKGAANKPIIYHFQDVHHHVPAQTNLYGLINELEEYAQNNFRSLAVFSEGAAGRVDSDQISVLENKQKVKDVGAGLLNAGILLGEELAAITHAPGRIQITGVENQKLYDQNVIAREQSKTARQAILKTVRQIHDQLRTLNRHNFNAELARLEKTRQQVEAGQASLVEYVMLMNNVNPELVSRYPSVLNILTIAKLETQVNLDIVESQARTLLEEKIELATESEVEGLIEQARQFKNGKVSAQEYYSSLLLGAPQAYPEIQVYVDYLTASQATHVDQLFEDLLRLEEEMAAHLLKHPVAVTLHAHLRWIERQARFFALEMIPAEWNLQRQTDLAAIYTQHKDIQAFVREQVVDLGYALRVPSFTQKELRAATKGARNFYRAATKRDEVMVQKLEAGINNLRGSRHVVAFIAGGFHTEAIMQPLKEKGFGYAVIRPHLDTPIELSRRYNFKPSNQILLASNKLRSTLGLAQMGSAIKAAVTGNRPVQVIAEAAQAGHRVVKENTDATTHDITSIFGISIKVIVAVVTTLVAGGSVAMATTSKTTPGEDQGTIVFRDEPNPRTSQPSQLWTQEIIDENLAGLNRDKLESLEIFGAPFELKNFKPIGKVRVQNLVPYKDEEGTPVPQFSFNDPTAYIPEEIENLHIDFPDTKKLIRVNEDGQIEVNNARLIITDGRRLSVIPFEEYEYPASRSISSKGLATVGILLGLLGLVDAGSFVQIPPVLLIAASSVVLGFAELANLFIGADKTGVIHEGLQSPNELRANPLVSSRLVGFAEWLLGGPQSFQVKAGILGEHQAGKIFLGSSLFAKLSNPISGLAQAALILIAVSHELIHKLIYNLPFEDSNAWADRSITELLAYPLGIVAIPFVGLHAGINWAVGQPSLATSFVDRRLVSATQAPQTRRKEIRAHVQNTVRDNRSEADIPGKSITYVDVASFGDNPKEVMAFLKSGISGQSGISGWIRRLVSTRDAHTILYNSDPRLRDYEVDVLPALAAELSDRRSNVKAKFIGYEVVQRYDGRAADLEQALGQEAGIDGRISDIPNVQVISARPTVVGFEGRPVINPGNNFVRLSLALSLYPRLMNASVVFDDLVTYFGSVFKIDMSQRIEDQMQAQILAALSA